MDIGTSRQEGRLSIVPLVIAHVFLASAPDIRLAMTVFEMIADERRGLADLVESLGEEQLRTPSWVPTRTVRDVAAHLIMAFDLSPLRFLWKLLVFRDFDRLADDVTWELAKKPAREIAAILRRNAENRFHPPGMGFEAPLTDLLVHGLDIRRPLGIVREIPRDRTAVALSFLFTTPARGFVKKPWREGLRFEATDCIGAWGSGPLIRGPSDELMLAVIGRVKALEGLEGDGVPILRARFQRGS
jgi:uncharacterized protein (TIGR03083 family)